MTSGPDSEDGWLMPRLVPDRYRRDSSDSVWAGMARSGPQIALQRRLDAGATIEWSRFFKRRSAMDCGPCFT